MKTNGLPNVDIALAPDFLLDLRHGTTADYLMHEIRHWIERMGYLSPGTPRIDGLRVTILPLGMGPLRAEARLQVGRTQAIQQFALREGLDGGSCEMYWDECEDDPDQREAAA